MRSLRRPPCWASWSRSARLARVTVACCITGTALGLVDAEDRRGAVAEPPAGGVHAAELGPLDLPVAALAPQLTGALHQEEHPSHAGVARRQAAAVGVHR